MNLLIRNYFRFEKKINKIKEIYRYLLKWIYMYNCIYIYSILFILILEFCG